MEGTLHAYTANTKLPLFVHTNGDPSKPAQTILLFVGGMYDSHTNTTYLSTLASLFRTSTTTRLVHPLLASHGRHFGISSLATDVRDLTSCMNYLHSSSLATPTTKIILLGHSTGCQDVLMYLNPPSQPSSTPRPKVHGAILQAAVSDRDGLLHALSTPSNKHNYDNCIAICTNTPDTERRTTLLPMHLSTPFFGPVPMSVARFWSLASPHSPEQPEDDDMFSSDCTQARLRATFGKAVSVESPLQPSSKNGKKMLCILLSGDDEYYPPHLSARSPEFLPRWKTAVDEAGGGMSVEAGVIDGAKHDLSGETKEAKWGRVELCRRVVGYMREVLGGSGVEEAVSEAMRRMEKVDVGVEDVTKAISGTKL